MRAGSTRELPPPVAWLTVPFYVPLLALLVALSMLVFDRACAFTAEIIVILNILWGGTWLVDLTVSRRVGKNRNVQGRHLGS